jgi:hypothetical protein
MLVNYELQSLQMGIMHGRPGHAICLLSLEAKQHRNYQAAGEWVLIMRKEFHYGAGARAQATARPDQPMSKCLPDCPWHPGSLDPLGVVPGDWIIPRRFSSHHKPCPTPDVWVYRGTQMPSTPRYHRRIFGGAYFSHCLFPVADPKAAALAFPSVADCRVFRSSAGFLGEYCPTRTLTSGNSRSTRSYAAFLSAASVS